MGIKTEIFDTEKFEVTYEVIPAVDSKTAANSSVSAKRAELQKDMQQLDQEIDFLEEKISKLNLDIDKLTNHADGLDYIIAVASGILTGLIDSLFVGELKIDIEGATEKIDKKVSDKIKDQVLKEKINQKIEQAKAGAKKKGEKLSKEEIEKIKQRVTEKFFSDPNNIADNGGDPVLKRAIKYLEDKNKVPQDNLFVGTGSSPSNHHLDDLAHHPTFVGLIASIVVQYFRVAVFVNKDGKYSLKLVSTDIKETISNWLPIVISGLLNWMVYQAEHLQDEEKIDTDIPKPVFKLLHLLATVPAIINILKVAQDWCLHLYSDVGGSETSAKNGTRGAGIPGLFISFLKEVSSVPPLNLTGLPKLVDHLYTDLKIDARKEAAYFSEFSRELGRQAIPVLINELLVRSFYFVRQLILEYKQHNGWDNINWQKVIPFGNRTVERMMTIATGTFTAVDLADAAIRSAVNPETVDPATFAKNMILRVNFVGIGRFAIAIYVDTNMGIKRSKLRNERIQVMNQQLNLLNAKVFYSIADFNYAMVDVFEEQEKMWYAAEDTAVTLEEAYRTTKQAITVYCNEMDLIAKSMKNISNYREGIANYNPDVLNNTLDILKWGNKK